jgi:hypothetical protein
LSKADLHAGYAGYAQHSSQQSVFLSSRLSGQLDHGTMFVAFVQGVVSSLHEYLSPFDERGSEESRYRADDHLLHESGVHSILGSIGNAIKWPEGIS